MFIRNGGAPYSFQTIYGGSGGRTTKEKTIQRERRNYVLGKQITFRVLWTVALFITSAQANSIGGKEILIRTAEENLKDNTISPASPMKKQYIVSTIDGKLMLLGENGKEKWVHNNVIIASQIDYFQWKTGKWATFIPSLTGNLYQFDDDYILSLAIDADYLLDKDFKFSRDIVVSGGIDLRTTGIDIETGRVLYDCRFTFCLESDAIKTPILLVKNRLQTVRMFEISSGKEKWNFSTGFLEISLTNQVTSQAAKNSADSFGFINVDITNGLLSDMNFSVGSAANWQFSAPIAHIWILEDYANNTHLHYVDPLLHTSVKAFPIDLYIGNFGGQLYAQESNALSTRLKSSMHRLPRHQKADAIFWKPSLLIATKYNSFGRENGDPVVRSLYNPFRKASILRPFYVLEKDRVVSEEPLIPLMDDGKIAIVINMLLTIVISLLAFSLACYAVVRLCRDGTEFIQVWRKQECKGGVPLLSKTTKECEGVQEKADHGIIPPYATTSTNFVSEFQRDFIPICRIGKGSYGKVFKAKKSIDGCEYAVKQIKLSGQEHGKVLREVEALSKLHHGGIVRYFHAWIEKPPAGWMESNDPFNKVTKQTSNVESSESSFEIVFDSESQKLKTVMDTSDGNHSIVKSLIPEVSMLSSSGSADSIVDVDTMYLYIQQELCQEGSLRDWLQDRAAVDHQETLSLFKQLVDAVNYMHSNNIIHRDLKPSNIFLALDPQKKNGVFLKIGDFGSATPQETKLLSSYAQSKSCSDEFGTELYSCPIQVPKKYSCKLDIYSLGLIFFELLHSFGTQMEKHSVLSKLHEELEKSCKLCNLFPQEHTTILSMVSRELESRPDAQYLSEWVGRRLKTLIFEQNKCSNLHHVQTLSNSI